MPTQKSARQWVGENVQLQELQLNVAGQAFPMVRGGGGRVILKKLLAASRSMKPQRRRSQYVERVEITGLGIYSGCDERAGPRVTYGNLYWM